MKLSEFKKNTIPFEPIIFLEEMIPHKARHKVLSFSWYILCIFLIGLYISKLYNHQIPILSNLLGLTLISLVISLGILLLEIFFRSYYYSGVTSSEIDAGRIIYHAKGGDLVTSLFSLPIGRRVVERAGIGEGALAGFMASRVGATVPDYDLPEVGTDSFFGTKELISAMWKEDTSLQKFLFDAGLNERDLAAILDWKIMEDGVSAKKERWWTRENLSEHRAIGKEWAFGRTFFLDKFSNDLSVDVMLFSSKIERSHRDDLVSQIEIVFSKAQNANIVVVGDPGAGVFSIIQDFVREIVSGRVHENVAYSRVVDLDWNSLISESKTKAVFEENFLRCLNESINAGNIIFVIQNLPGLITSAEALGTTIISLLAPYFEKNVQFMATADPVFFHQKIENSPTLVQYFQKVIVEEPDAKKMLEIVESYLREIENTHRIIFTYPAVLEIIRSATYYITIGVMPAKAINLLSEMVANANFTNMKIVGKKEVLDFVRLKTNIPVGDIQKNERETLLHMEVALHKRVVGQAEAIISLSNAMRRSRAGVRDPKKPIGSFLFLGPTGVGKTETAKALAQIFYGDEKYMLRLDMSEYQSSDSINRLIGSFEDNKSGVLSNMLRENPYGVLLLDEFEKADKEVLNLFLQILDEGFFSDMTGKRVSTQNIIFIATSNAASAMIFDITEKGGDVSKSKTEIINSIVSQGIYKPELINRFDDVVIFHPLNKDELQQITGLMLKKLAVRLQEKGIELVINPFIVQKIMDAGYNRTFGARPMNRAIQEQVEEPIARKIIEGSLPPGSKMEFQ